MNRPNEAALRKFATGLQGSLVLPQDRDYEQLRRVWNHAVDAYPALIVRCAGSGDVRRAVEFARTHDLRLAIRSGSHSFAGHGVCSGGMVIDLSLMKQASINPQAGMVRIEPGIRGYELDLIVQAFKLVVPLGSCPAVGVAGYALGGGESSLTPKFGYACDNLLKVELITADGELLTASAEQNADLFWGLCGAGANFGIAVGLEFQLHPQQKVLSGHLKYPLHQAKTVLKFVNDYAPTMPDELFLNLAVLPHAEERLVDVSVVWPGAPERGAQALHSLRTFLTPSEDTIEIRDYLDEQRAGADAPGEGDYSSHRRAGHLEQLSASVIETIIEHAADAPAKSCGITMIYWHGPWSAQPRDNAFGFRRCGYQYWIHSYWQAQQDEPRAIEWVERFFAAMVRHSTGAVYVNDLKEEGAERVRAAYGDKLPRLQSLKRKYDPHNIFRVNQNIVLDEA